MINSAISAFNFPLSAFRKAFRFLLSAFRLTLCAALFLSITGTARAAAITVNSSENWSAITTGSGPGGQPSATDTITITTGATLTVNVANGVCASIQIGSTSILGGNGTLTFDANDQVTVSGAVTIGSANFLAGNGSINMGSGGTLIADSFTVGRRAHGRQMPRQTALQLN